MVASCGVAGDPVRGASGLALFLVTNRGAPVPDCDAVICTRVIYAEVIYAEVIYAKVLYTEVIYAKVIYTKVVYTDGIYAKVICTKAIKHAGSILSQAQRCSAQVLIYP